MDNSFNFLLEIGKLKGKKRRGWEIHKIKNPETTAEHVLHLTMLVWILGRDKKINLEKAIKIALIHDLCEIYAPDFTSYDAAAIQEKGRITIKQVLALKPVTGRPTTNQRKKLKKIKQKLEEKAMKKILAKAPEDLKKEIYSLWREYEEGSSKEARFVKQSDKIINLIQGLEYWRKYGKIKHYLWMRRIKEVIDDPDLLKMIKSIEKEFYKNYKDEKKKNKR